MDIFDLQDNMNDFMSNLDATAMSIVESSEGQLVKLVQNQLQQGEDGAGNTLRAYRDREYAEYKLTLNPRGVTDLKLFGDFYAGMQLLITGGLRGGEFAIISTDSKYQELKRKYGKYITELSKDSSDKFRRERFNVFLLQLLAAQTGLGVSV